MHLHIKWQVHVIFDISELVASSHDHDRLISAEGLLRQMATFVIEKPMAVSTPRYSLHQNSMKTKRLDDPDKETPLGGGDSGLNYRTRAS